MDESRPKFLKLVSNQKQKQRPLDSGTPIVCKRCNNNPNLIETRRPRFKDGRVVKGKGSVWLCPYCMNIVWP
ncbi:hypothetical protein CLV77_1405 [Brevirhabdus pacifica]|nr:hypothetical protein CLV77_1405 [Brevirhabdus pacifica]